MKNGKQANVMYGILTALMVFMSLGVLYGEDQFKLSDVKQRVKGRVYPSIFQAWNKADNLKGEDEWRTVARHDLMFHDPAVFWLKWNHEQIGLADGFTRESIGFARGLREKLHGMNPNLVLLGEVRYRDAHLSYLPDDHPWWKRDKDGKRIVGWAEGGYYLLDFGNEDYQRHLAKQARAMVESGVLDGVMLDWWHEYGDQEVLKDRLALLKRIRQAVGEKGLILVNSNHNKVPASSQYVNGLFMECYDSAKPEQWKKMSDTLRWAEKNLREPRINCIEAWYRESRKDFHLMRAVTTMSLTHGEGYALFSDPNPLPTPDHLHDWYQFWNEKTGKGLGNGRQREDGAWERAFERGLVVYNPPGNGQVEVHFEQPHRSKATGVVGLKHEVKAWDGDMFFRVGK